MDATYDTDKCSAAIDRYIADPKSLTDEDLEQFQIINPELADYARAKRAGFEEALTDEERERNKKPLTFGTFLMCMRTTVPQTSSMIYRIRDAHAKIEALEKRVQELSARPELKYRGVFDAMNVYAEGHAATHQGGIWIAKRPTMKVPGNNNDDWTLAVKSGRDAR